jgi:hypothetical protein
LEADTAIYGQELLTLDIIKAVLKMVLPFFYNMALLVVDDAVFQQFGPVQVIDSVYNLLSSQFGDKIIYFKNATDNAMLLPNNGLAEMKAVFGE